MESRIENPKFKNKDVEREYERISLQKMKDKENLSYFMSLIGLHILLGWAIYMLISLASALNFGNLSPETYTLLRHSAIVIVGLILTFKGTSRVYRNPLRLCPDY